MTELERVQLFEAAGLDKIISKDFKAYLIVNGFFRSPASTKFHGAYEGGLFDHSLMVMNTLVDLSAKKRPEMAESRKPFHCGYVPRPVQNRPVPSPYLRNDLRWEQGMSSL